MAHAALLGVALALLLEINITLGVFVIAAAVAFALLLLQRQRALPTDALLSILSHSTLALGLVMVAFMAWVRIDLLSYLFGDLLAVSRLAIAVIWCGGAAVLGILSLSWRPRLACPVSEGRAAAQAVATGGAARASRA